MRFEWYAERGVVANATIAKPRRAKRKVPKPEGPFISPSALVTS